MANDKDNAASLRRLVRWKKQSRQLVPVSEISPAIAQPIEKAGERLGKVGALWDAHAPENLRRSCRPLALNRGVLVIVAQSTSAAAMLRGELARGLRSILVSRGGVGRVRVQIDATGAGNGF